MQPAFLTWTDFTEQVEICMLEADSANISAETLLESIKYVQSDMNRLNYYFPDGLIAPDGYLFQYVWTKLHDMHVVANRTWYATQIIDTMLMLQIDDDV